MLRSLLRIQMKESERLKRELQKAYAQLRDKDEGKAEQLALQLATVERQHASALKLLFGSKSERRPVEKAKKERKPQEGHGPRPQPQLEIVPVVHVCKDMNLQCYLCSSPLVPWQDQFEDSVEIDFIAPQFVVRKHLRQKYRCTCGGCIVTAPGPQKLFPKARYSINVAVHVALQKYAYHQPLSRQVKIFSRLGLDITSATLWDYLCALYGLLKPAFERLHEYVLSQPVMGVDETTWRLLKSETPGKSKAWWVWARRVENAVHYTLDPSRGSAVAIRLLQDYTGTIIVDGYSVYEKALKANPSMKLAHCWSHARRELLPFEDGTIAARALRVIRRMYRLEAWAREKGLSPPELLRWRQRKTKPLLQAFFRWVGGLHVPSSFDLCGALKYILKRQQSLMLFLEDPLLSPDNNATEGCIRGVVLGRKTHYGSRSEHGTRVAALMYSLLDSAELAGVDPGAYLNKAVHAALARDVIPLPHELTVDDLAAGTTG